MAEDRDKSGTWNNPHKAFQNFIDAVPGSLLALDPELRIRFFNRLPAGLDIPVERILGAHPWELFDDPKAAEKLERELTRRLQEPCESRRLDISVAGEGPHEVVWRFEIVSAKLLSGACDLLIRLTDVSEQKKLASELLRLKDFKENLLNQLIHSEKMAGIDTLARGVAHEFNNLIGGMLGFAQLADSTGELEDYKKSVQVVFEESQRAKVIIGNLLTFARREPEKIETIALRELVEQVLSLIEGELRKNSIGIQVDVDSDCVLSIDVAEFQQVLLHHFINAMHAMMENRGGLLSVWARRKRERVEIEIRDNGVGIPPESVSRIFEPFFTTKGSIGTGRHSGSGLGLSFCYGIIKKLRGEITVKSNPGEDTVFRIVLPVAAAEERPPDRPKEAMESPKILLSKAKKVLVVDDEPIIRELVRSMFVRAGYQVDIAPNGFAGIERARFFDPDIAVVDAQMPGISGVETTRELLREKPSLKVLMITGKAGGEFESFQSEMGAMGYGVIQKPFSMDEILRAVAALEEKETAT